ncbi:MAG: hypothetical protein MJK12_00955 [Colwellia sp.]|nr:hypothetical protein [Colwellia sp.]
MSKIIISITEAGDAEAKVNGQAKAINDLNSKKGGKVSFENTYPSLYSFTFAEWPFEGEMEAINVGDVADQKQKVKKTLVGPAGIYAFTYSKESSGGGNVGGGVGGSGSGHITVED